MQLRGRKILLGITGSIAAYKTPDLVRLFIKEGAEVRVVMTPASREFVTPLSLSTVSRNPVESAFVRDDDQWVNHVELGTWADLFLVAPVTANTMARLATGICDSLLAAVYLSARCPVMMAPAMDLDMYRHTSTRQNIKTLAGHGVEFIGPATGDLASGLSGEGRMEEPEVIFAHVLGFFAGKSDFLGRKVLVTAGPTREAIDPVRFISNHSSGKMGYALAEAFRMRGADVTLVSGPTGLTPPGGVKTIAVESAGQMHKACMKAFPGIDVTVMAAAVADYTPAKAARNKIKKDAGDTPALALKPTEDILATMGREKKSGQVLVGFALETTDEVANARKKLRNKNLDFIVLNSLRDQGAGFHSDTNKITIIEKGKKPKRFPLKRKADVANDILDSISRLI